MPRDIAADIPRTVRLTFPGRACGKATSAPASWDADVDLADASPANAGRGVDATWGVSDTCTAAYTDATPTADPSNKSSLVALARRLAHDLWEWRTVGYDRAYAGVVAPDLGGLDDAVEWSYRADDCSTRLSTSTDDEPDRFNHADPANDCPDCVGVYGPALGKSGTSVLLRKYKVCLEGGEVKSYPDGDDAIAGCCGTPNCTSPLTVYAGSSCSSSNLNLAGAVVTVRRLSDNAVVASGPTDANGRYQVYLPPVSGNGYEVSAKYKGYDPIAVSPGNGLIPPGQPIRVRCTCSNTISFGFPPFRFAATAVGCGNVPMPGVDVKLYQRYADGTTALLLGQGTTDAAGAVTLDLQTPITNIDRLLGVATSDDFYQGFLGFDKGPNNNPNPCVLRFNVSQQTGTASNYPDVPGLDQSERLTSNGWNAKDYQQCCAPLSGTANRYRPYPATLHGTVGPYSVTLTSTGGIWRGTFTATMPGAAKQPDGSYNCVVDPAYATPVSTCIRASFTCDGLAMTYLSCRNVDLPLEVTCEEREALEQSPLGVDVQGINCFVTSRSGDPFVLEGESDLGPWVVTE